MSKLIDFSLSRLILISNILILLTACSGNQQAEGLFAPDPNLQQGGETNPSPSPSNPTDNTPKVPENFPQEIPLYPRAKLASTTLNKTTWQTQDPSNAVIVFYQQNLDNKKWENIQNTNTDNLEKITANKGDLQLTIAINLSSPTTEFTIEYQQKGNVTPSPSPTTTSSPPSSVFIDLEQAPQELQTYLKDLANLGILTGVNNQQQFAPNEPIKRRDFALWLVRANNQFYANDPGKQIRLASKNSQPAFTDIKPNDPNFEIIQGLAEAGIIPSKLSNDPNALLFRSDAPLTREDLILWKVPLDMRKNLPQASIDAIKETWGFQDVAKIQPNVLRALYGDFQNGGQANVRRIFGYTTLFQPKKPVSRAEAAVALWYFGYQGDGVSASDALSVK
jgi:hypothetical protein